MLININELGLIVLIMIAGILGGSVNYLTEEKKEFSVILWLNRVVLGIAASFLMPLFLKTISSDLVHNVLSETDNLTGDVFVLFGFCLIGAISSRILIQTLSESILQTAKEAKETAETTSKEVSELKSEVDPIVEKATEQEDNDEKPLVLTYDLEDTERSILKALIHQKYTLRSKTGISKQTGLDLSTITDGLSSLKVKSLAAEIQGRKGPRWSITSMGYDHLENLKDKPDTD